MMPEGPTAAQARLDAYLKARGELERHAMELLAKDLGLDIETLEEQLRDRSDFWRDRRETLQDLLRDKIEFVKDDGD